MNHAFLYVGGGQLLEAEPHGARLRPVNEYGAHAIWSQMPLDRGQQERIVTQALKLVGTPYGWPDIAAIALAQRRLGRLLTSRSWLARRLGRPDRLICSQLCDLVYKRAGIQLWDDGRLPGLVSPGDLLDLIRKDGAA